MIKVVISIGSNIEPEVNVNRACEILERMFLVAAVSSFQRTKPVGPVAQDDFLNGVALIETDMQLDDLRDRLKQVERDLGRPSGGDKWGPRVMDLDVILYGGRIVDPDYYERDFLQRAVKEIMPNLKLRCY